MKREGRRVGDIRKKWGRGGLQVSFPFRVIGEDMTLIGWRIGVMSN